MTYDKRKILNLDVNYEDVKMIDTLAWGHNDIQEHLHKITNA